MFNIRYDLAPGADEARARAIMAAVPQALMVLDGRQWVTLAAGENREVLVAGAERLLSELVGDWRDFIVVS